MMRKLFTFLCAALMSAGMWAVPATCGDGLTWELNAGVLTISYDGVGTGDMYDYDDEGNFAPWYSSRESITSVIISNGVTSIGQMAFLFCTGLTSVTIPNSVTSIGMGAFGGCTGLTSIEIPNSVKSIGQLAFVMCSSLESVTINAESLESYGTNAFQGTAEGLKIYVPAGSVDTYKTAWADYADKIVAIVVEGVQIDGLYYNLKNNNKTAEVTYKSYTNYKYNEGWGITTANIPASVEYNSVTYSVTSIGYSAFRNCSGLTSITIPNGVTSIDSRAFQDCTGLTSVTIPSSVKSIGSSTFGMCTALTSIEIPNSVEYIDEQAFAGSGLTSIEIPNSVDSIAGDAFLGCSGLTSIVVASGNTKYDSRENCNAIIETSTNTLFLGCQNTIIPNSVTSIGQIAFAMCGGLASIEIPNSVTSIGDYAFAMCSSLASVTINATTPPTLGSGTFEGTAEGLKIYVPAGSVDAYKAADGWSAYADKIEAIPAKYYIVGNMTDWKVNEAYEMSYNELAEAEEYSFRMHLTTDNQFKVVKVEGENQTWYPEGMGNNYGEHGEITGEANYNIYFRPNADGDEAWFYNLILVERRIVIEPVVFSVKVPENGKPESIEIVGDFGEGWENGVVLEPNGGWYMTDALFADEYDEFKIRGAGSWDNEIYVRTETGWTASKNFRFGALWKEGTRDEAPIRVIELDLSGDNYGWKQIVQSIDNINLKSEIKNHKLVVDGVIYIVRDGKLYNATGAEVK